MAAASPEPAVDQIARSAFLEGVNEVYRPPTGADQDLSPTDSSPAPHGSAGARCVPSKASGIGCGNQFPSPQGDAWLDSVAGANQQVKQMIGVSDPFRMSASNRLSTRALEARWAIESKEHHLGWTRDFRTARGCRPEFLAPLDSGPPRGAHAGRVLSE
jgi:hypothetical protein